MPGLSFLLSLLLMGCPLLKAVGSDSEDEQPAAAAAPTHAASGFPNIDAPPFELLDGPDWPHVPLFMRGQAHQVMDEHPEGAEDPVEDPFGEDPEIIALTGGIAKVAVQPQPPQIPADAGAAAAAPSSHPVVHASIAIAALRGALHCFDWGGRPGPNPGDFLEIFYEYMAPLRDRPPTWIPFRRLPVPVWRLQNHREALKLVQTHTSPPPSSPPLETLVGYAAERAILGYLLHFCGQHARDPRCRELLDRFPPGWLNTRTLHENLFDFLQDALASAQDSPVFNQCFGVPTDGDGRVQNAKEWGITRQGNTEEERWLNAHYTETSSAAPFTDLYTPSGELCRYLSTSRDEARLPRPPLAMIPYVPRNTFGHPVSFFEALPLSEQAALEAMMTLPNFPTTAHPCSQAQVQRSKLLTVVNWTLTTIQAVRPERAPLFASYQPYFDVVSPLRLCEVYLYEHHCDHFFYGPGPSEAEPFHTEETHAYAEDATGAAVPEQVCFSDGQ